MNAQPKRFVDNAQVKAAQVHAMLLTAVGMRGMLPCRKLHWLTMVLAQTVKIVRARPEDLETVAVILDDAAQWLQGRGIDQWPFPFPRRWIQRRFQTGEVYLGMCAGQAIGTFSLHWSDELDQLWSDLPGDAGYLHGLAVRRAFARRGVGTEMLRQAARIVAAVGKPYLRLDCWSQNRPLCHYYERHDFVDRGVIELTVGAEAWSCRRFEKQIVLEDRS